MNLLPMDVGVVEQGETRLELFLRIGDFQYQAIIRGGITIDEITIHGETSFLEEDS
jgi:hypothetical protein